MSEFHFVTLRDIRLPFLLGGILGIGLILVGILMAGLMQLAACPLCIWQRIMYLLYSGFAFAGLAVWRHGVLRRVLAAFMAVAAACGAGIAGYQVWIQRFAPLTTCAGKEPWWEAVITWLGKQVPLLFEASGLCSDLAWTFLSLSIADWSLMAFVVLLVLAVYATARNGCRASDD